MAENSFCEGKKKKKPTKKKKKKRAATKGEYSDLSLSFHSPHPGKWIPGNDHENKVS